MKPSLRSAVAYKIVFPLRYRYDLAVARGSSVQRRLRILVASDNLASTSEFQFDPLWRNRSLLLDQGIILNRSLIDAVLASTPRAGYDAVLAKLSFLTPKPEAIAKMERLRALYPAARLIYFDGDDDCCVQWPELLPIVDLYVKKHVFADPAWYQRQFTGKNNLTDYVARMHGRSFADNIIPHSGCVPPAQAHKILLGWNIAGDDKVANLFQTTSPAPFAEKTNDVICRAACSQDLWIYPLRGPVSQALEPLAHAGRRLLLPTHRVDEPTYQAEMRSSRICVSPFGYGELCWRDFEAVLAGCLLVKPAMGHILTEPNIFVAGETYVPVRWDFSDLAETCERYLADPPEMARIARNAYRVLADFYNNHSVVRRFAELLDAAGLTCERRGITAECSNAV